MTDSSKLSTYKLYTIGWIAALDKELTAALAMLDETHEQPDDFEQNDKDSNTYSWGRNGEHNIVIASLGGGSYGKVSAATTATCMATSFPHLRFGLLVGIGAGIPRLEQDIDIRLGDVVVSVPTGEHPGVVQYDLGKKRDNGRLERVGALNRPPEILLSGINKLRGHQRLNGSKLPQILNEAVRLHPMLGKPKGKDPPFIYQGSQHDRLFESTSMHVETGHGGIQSHSPRPNEVSRNLPQLMYYGLRLTLVWLWTLVYFLLTARKPLDPDVNIMHQETTVAQSCLNCDPKKEISRESRQTIDPEIHYGNIASGDLVVKGGRARDLIIQSLGKTFLCFEMEAAGLMNNFPCLVIRGICDYADSHKNDRWQNYAALAAAAYAKELLSAVDARKVERADKMEKIMAEDTKQAVQSMNDERLLEKMYTWLSAPDPSVNYQTALSQRYAGTCDWFLHSEQYDRWKTGSASSLWIYGGPGCGKTILSSVIISDLKAFEDDTPHLLFFFFSFTDSKKQSLDGVVRSLTSQLSRQSESARAYLTSTFKSKYEKSSEQPSTAQLCDILQCMLQRSKNSWVVLDALDEGQLGSSFKNEGLLSWLQSLLAPRNDKIRTLVTSRWEQSISNALNGCIPEQLCLQGDLVAGDIEAFIDETIKHWDGLRIWREYERVQKEIRDHLTENSNGMFRWVSCQLDALAPLQDCRDHEALLATLYSLPKSLDGTYARILGRIPEALRAKAYRILQFLLHSETPLYLEEIVEIVVFSPKPEMSTRRVDNSIKPEKDAISIYCPNLVECVEVFDEASKGYREILQLAHCSVRDFLLSDGLENSTFRIFQPRFALGSMARVCLSYLLDIEDDQPLDQVLLSYPLATYAASFWTQYTKQADTSMILEPFQEFVRREGCYKRYCQLLGIKCDDRHMPCSRARWLKSFHCITKSAEKRFISNSVLDHFAMIGLWWAVEEIIRRDIGSIDADGAYFGDALREAVHADRKEVVQLLLGAGANPNGQRDEDGSPLQAAAKFNHQEIVGILLNAGANPNAQGGHYGDALQAAASGGHQEVVQLLLNAGANLNAKRGHYGSPLNAAVYEDRREVIHTLLDGGADPNICGEGDYGNALYVAAYRGNSEVMQILLDAGADPHDFGGKLGNSLSAAIAGNHRDAVQILLDLNANVNGHNVLYTAAKYADVDIIELLLRKGATVDEKALLAAFEKNRPEEVIEKLLGDITLTDSVERCMSTELAVACVNHRHGRAQILLDAGANVNLPTKFGDTALYVAASRGLKSMFELFLDKASAVRQSDYIPDGSIHDTSLTHCTNLDHLLSMPGADAKRLLGKALACSALSGSRDAVRLLAETCQAYHQAYPESAHKRESLEEALARAMRGVKKGCDTVVRLLLDQGADPNVRVSGEPSLCHLVKTNNVEDKETFKALVELLLDRGADASIQGTYGCALDTALRERSWELVGMLRDKGVEKTPMYRFMEAKVDRELRRHREECAQD